MLKDEFSLEQIGDTCRRLTKFDNDQTYIDHN